MFGIGLRTAHFSHLLGRPKTGLDWFEAISENYMDSFGRPLQVLSSMREDYPIGLHGVGLSLASATGIDRHYLENLKALIERINPFIVSDHLCWSHTAAHHIHDLLPFPFTSESLEAVCSNILRAQDFLKRPIAVENISSYLRFKESEWSEWEFMAEVAKKTNCHILLDLNNVYVNSKNHGFDAKNYLSSIPLGSVAQVHLAGHTDCQDYLFDTHSQVVCDDVWTLYEDLARLCPAPYIPTLIEWDADIPEFEQVEAEALLAKEKWENAKRFTLANSKRVRPLCESTASLQ